MKGVLFIAILLILIIVGSGYAGYIIKPVEMEYVDRIKYVPYETVKYINKPIYEIIEKPIYIDRPVPEIVEVIKEVPVEKVIEIYREVYPDHRLFADLAEFQAWFSGIAVTMLTGDCDDWGEIYCQVAANDGFLLPFQWVDRDGMMNGLRVMPSSRNPHMGLLLMTQQGMIYFVEPQPDEFEIIKIGPRD